MNVEKQIKEYIAGMPEAKQKDMQALHQHILKLLPKAKLWFFDGTDETGKKVSNPNIGYGAYHIHYADGSSREFYQIGFSANNSGISLYVMGIKDKKYLADTYGNNIGKASITSYCIKFKKLADINLDVLDKAILDGVSQSKTA